MRQVSGWLVASLVVSAASWAQVDGGSAQLAPAQAVPGGAPGSGAEAGASPAQVEALAQPLPQLPEGRSLESEGSQKLTLPQAVDRALRANPNLNTAREEISRYWALVEQARSVSLPQLSVGATYTHLDHDRQLSGAVISAQNQLGGNASLSVPLLAASRWFAWRRAHDQYLSEKLNAEEVRRQIGSATARAFLTILTARRSVDLNDRARLAAKAHLDFSRARRLGGVGTKLDEVRAEQQFHIVEVQEAQALLALTRAREVLGQLVGNDGPVDAVDEFPLPPLPALDSAIAAAREHRTDVSLQRSRLDTARRSAEAGWTDYLPLLTAVVQPFFQNPPTLTQPLTGWQAQLVLTLPLYDGGLRSGTQHERVALRNEAQLSVDAALRQVGADVRTAVEEVVRADEALRSARLSAQNANEVMALTNLAYRAGATTNIEVIDAERAARDAESQAAGAEDAARQARLDLLVASGRFP